MRRWFENRVGDETDALGNLLFPQRKQGGLRKTQPVQLFQARLAVPDVDFHLALLGFGQLLEEVIPQIER
jgi:hypothetical protein